MLDYSIVIHPPTNPKNRAYCGSLKEDDDIWRMPEKSYLARNKDIVDQSETMIALPIDPNREILRSGTWAAVRYARKTGVPVLFV